MIDKMFKILKKIIKNIFYFLFFFKNETEIIFKKINNI